MQKAIEALYKRVSIQSKYNSWVSDLVKHLDSFQWSHTGIEYNQCYWRASIPVLDGIGAPLISITLSIKNLDNKNLDNYIQRDEPYLWRDYNKNNISFITVFAAKNNYLSLEDTFYSRFQREDRYIQLSDEEGFDKVYAFITQLQKYLMSEMSLDKVP